MITNNINIWDVQKIRIQEVIIFLMFFGRMNGDLSGNDYVFAGLLVLALIVILIERRINLHSLGFVKWQISFYAIVAASSLWSIDRTTTLQYMFATFGKTSL